ncbi:MAG: polysaccharide deacetylase family protein [Paludibacteraceae bacterium]
MRNLVLTFHNVTDAVWFEQVIAIVSRFYHIGTLDQLYGRLNGTLADTPSWMCFFTFDDGERSVYDIVFPIIKKRKLPIALFVSPENIQKGGSFWFQRMRKIDATRIENMKQYDLNRINTCINQLDSLGITDVDANINLQMFVEMLDSGLVTFGAHTQHHPILANESLATVTTEICDSISELATLSKHEILYFAYPNGGKTDFSEREISILQQEEIIMAFSLIPGFADNKDMYRIKRVGLTNGTWWHIALKIFFPIVFDWIKSCVKGMSERKWNRSNSSPAPNTRCN